MCEPDFAFDKELQRGVKMSSIPYDPDVYSEALEAHWSERAANPVEYYNAMCTEDSCAPAKEDENKVRIAEIAFEELEDDADLAKGLKTKALKEVSFIPTVYRVAPKADTYFSKSLDVAEQDEHGNYVLTVDTYCKKDDVIDDDILWTVFNIQGLIMVNITSSKVLNSNHKFFKVSQKIKVAVVNQNCVPYLQLICNARRVKYAESWFREGDVITLFVQHQKMPKVPSPPILSIQPKAEQTFVPMLPKQKLQVITDLSQSELEWRLDGDSALIYHGRQEIGMDFARRIGTNVVCDFFECVKDTQTQELIFVNSRNENRSKTICVPVIAYGVGNRRYPVIFDPVKTSAIYAHNISGFILRSKSHVPLRIDKDCPLLPIYSMDGRDYCETKVKLTKFQPYFILERQGNQWFARSN